MTAETLEQIAAAEEYIRTQTSWWPTYERGTPAVKHHYRVSLAHHLYPGQSSRAVMLDEFTDDDWHSFGRGQNVTVMVGWGAFRRYAENRHAECWTTAEILGENGSLCASAPCSCIPATDPTRGRDAAAGGAGGRNYERSGDDLR